MKTVKCDECGIDAIATQQEELPDGGLELVPRLWGYYGGFTDNIPWQEATDTESIVLCHDCCVRLMYAFPSIAQAMGVGGHHPCRDEIPCCSYAWKATPDFGKYDGGVYVRTQHPVIDDATGGLKWEDDEPE